MGINCALCISSQNPNGKLEAVVEEQNQPKSFSNLSNDVSTTQQLQEDMLKKENKSDKAVHKKVIQNKNINKKFDRRNGPRQSAFLNRTCLRILLFGPAKCGKTSFLIRFCDNKFQEEYIHTEGEEIYNKKTAVNYRFYDIKFTTIDNNDIDDDLKKHIDSVDFYLVLYDNNDNESFLKSKEIYENHIASFKEDLEGNFSNVVFISCKSDLESKVNENEIKTFTETLKVPHFKISSKTNDGMTNMTKKIIEAFDANVFKFSGDANSKRTRASTSSDANPPSVKKKNKKNI